MLLSRQKQFLFVHIQKTAGSSLRQALSAALPDLQPFLGTHDHAAWARPHLAHEWPSYFKAAFVRNPWDRLVSWWTMIRTQEHYTNRFWEYLRQARSFEEFLDRTEVIEDHDGSKSIRFDQLDYLTDERGELLVDFIGRYENLNADAAALFQRLGVAATLPHINRSDHLPYSAYYTERTRDLVAERHRRDIDYFRYDFREGKPTCQGC